MKPSPWSSLLLFGGAALLLVALVSKSWLSYGMDNYSFSFGILRGEMCTRTACESTSMFGGGLGLRSLLAILMALLTLGGVGLSIPLGFMLFKPGRRALSLVTLIIVGCSALLAMIFVLQGMSMSFGYAIGVFGAGVAAVLAACIMAMMRPAPRRSTQQRMSMGPQMYQRPHMYQMGMAPQQPQPQPAYQPMQQLPTHGTPCLTCSFPTTWVAQHERWFCTRCQKYV